MLHTIVVVEGLTEQCESHEREIVHNTQEQECNPQKLLTSQRYGEENATQNFIIDSEMKKMETIRVSMKRNAKNGQHQEDKMVYGAESGCQLCKSIACAEAIKLLPETITGVE